MRKLVLLQGPPGSGKSTWIASHGLEPYTLEPDKLRLMFRSPVIGKNGALGIDQITSKDAWAMTYQILEKRMTKGDTTFIDATHCSRDSVRRYRELCNKFDYELIVVRFNLTLPELLRNNTSRAGYKVVPEEVVVRMHQELKGLSLKNIRTIDAKDWSNDILAEGLVADLTKDKRFDKVVFFGDLQGTCSPLHEYFVKNPLSKSTLYVFTGDYVDRGLENHLAVQFVLKHSKLENFVFLEGNHERHLRDYANGRPGISKEFDNKTRPQFEKAGITPKLVAKLVRHLKPCLLVKTEYGTFFASHAGLGVMPKEEDLGLISMRQLTNGTGDYSWKVDEFFDFSSSLGEFQVHGHRNPNNLPLHASPRSFNLEGKVEFGGSLRILSVDTKEPNFQLIEEINQGPVSDSILDTSAILKDSTLLAQLRSNPMIQEKILGNDISSFNFKREVFFDKTWSAQTVKARGLFVATDTGEIVARSYDKFFHVNEVSETSKENIDKAIESGAPVTVKVKENGFLGIVGYKPGYGMVIASKSTIHGEYAGIFKAMLESALGEKGLKVLESFVSKGRSVVFEAVNPTLDPHIVEYDQNYLFVLDAFHNRMDNAKMSEEELEALMRDLWPVLPENSCTSLSSAATIRSGLFGNSYTSDMLWQTLENIQKTHKTEGVVVSVGDLMFKVKTDFYTKWKAYRRVRDSLLRGAADSSVRSYAFGPEALDFFNKPENKNTINLSIPEIRRLYEKSNNRNSANP